MIWDHIAGETNPVMIRAIAEIDVGRFPAQILGDLVIEERVSRGHGVLVAAKLLNGLRRSASLPDANQPERIDATMSEGSELLVGNLIESRNSASILLAQLRQPDIGALGNQ